MNSGIGIFILALFLVAVIVVFTRRSGGSGFMQANKESKYSTIDDRYNEQKKAREDELNRLLEKIHTKGIDSLSKSERARLDELTKK